MFPRLALTSYVNDPPVSASQVAGSTDEHNTACLYSQGAAENFL
jgi:hypothetical protein